MLTSSELAGMRVTSISALPDIIEISRPSEGGTLDPITGTWTPNVSTPVYSGPGRVRLPASTTEMERIFGDTEVTVQRYVAMLPWDAVGIQRGDRIGVVDGSDPEVGGRSFRVVAIAAGSNWIDRLIGCEEVDR